MKWSEMKELMELCPWLEELLTAEVPRYGTLLHGGSDLKEIARRTINGVRVWNGNQLTEDVMASARYSSRVTSDGWDKTDWFLQTSVCGKPRTIRLADGASVKDLVEKIKLRRMRKPGEHCPHIDAAVRLDVHGTGNENGKVISHISVEIRLFPQGFLELQVARESERLLDPSSDEAMRVRAYADDEPLPPIVPRLALQ